MFPVLKCRTFYLIGYRVRQMHEKNNLKSKRELTEKATRQSFRFAEQLFCTPVRLVTEHYQSSPVQF